MLFISIVMCEGTDQLWHPWVGGAARQQRLKEGEKKSLMRMKLHRETVSKLSIHLLCSLYGMLHH